MQSQFNLSPTFSDGVYMQILNRLVLSQNCEKNVGRFSARLRYIERKSALESTTKPRGGYRYTVYCHGIPLSGKRYDVTFFLLRFIRTVF